MLRRMKKKDIAKCQYREKIRTDITSIVNHLSVEKEKKGQTPIVDFYVYKQQDLIMSEIVP